MINEHIKTVSQIFEGYAVIADALSEEDGIIHLLANLPETFNVLVTALEAQSENIPKWDLLLRGCCTRSQSSRKGHYTLGRWS